MLRKLMTLCILGVSCSPGGKEPEAQSCIKTVVSEDVNITGGVEKTFYWGYADIKYNPSLAETVFSTQSEKIEKIRDKSEFFRCRVFYVPNGNKLDAWTSRHCLMSIAIQELNLYIFDDDNKKQKVNFPITRFSGWPKVADLVKSLEGIEDSFGEAFLDGFVSKNLYFNAFNSRLYDVSEARSKNIRYNILQKKDEDLFGINHYYKSLFEQSKPEQAYLKRDLCSTDFNITTLPNSAQHVCFSTTDLSLIQIDRPKSLKLPDYKKKLYPEWVASQVSFEIAVTKFMLEELAYRLANACLSARTDRKSCPAAAQLNNLVALSEDFKTFGTGPVEIDKIISSVFEAGSDLFSKDKIIFEYRHLTNLNKTFENLSKVFRNVQDEYLDASQIALAGIYTERKSQNSRLGLISFMETFAEEHAFLNPRVDGFYFSVKSSRVIFEKADSGSMLLSRGFPLAVLSTVNGKASSGGSSSLGKVEVAQIDDVVDPSIFAGAGSELAIEELEPDTRGVSLPAIVENKAGGQEIAASAEKGTAESVVPGTQSGRSGEASTVANLTPTRGSAPRYNNSKPLRPGGC